MIAKKKVVAFSAYMQNIIGVVALWFWREMKCIILIKYRIDYVAFLSGTNYFLVLYGLKWTKSNFAANMSIIVIIKGRHKWSHVYRAKYRLYNADVRLLGIKSDQMTVKNYHGKLMKSL